MTHDPLCWLAGPDAPDDAKETNEWCECEFIAKIRADERAACIAAVEALVDSINYHYRITCEPSYTPNEKIDWSQHRNCDPIDDILAALREVQP